MKDRTLFNRQIAEEAAAWSVRLDDGPMSTDQKRQLLQWLKTSPAHFDEFLLALSIYEGARLYRSSIDEDLDVLLAEASANVVALDRSGPDLQPADPPLGLTRRAGFSKQPALAAIAACVLIGLTVGGLYLSGRQAHRAEIADTKIVIETGLGEQRSVTLSDGSIVYVNTQSKVTVLYSDDVRRIDLAGGEALFEVTKDADRPFRVYAGDTLTEAVGTKFNVRFFDNAAEVSVLEGTVALQRPQSGFDLNVRDFPLLPEERIPGQVSLQNGRILLSAGSQAEFENGATFPVLSIINTEAAAAWTGRRLVFDAMSVSAAAEEFNRYNRIKLVVSDPDIAAQRISGVFAADDPQSLAAFLELTSDVAVIQTFDELRIVKTINP